jgi:hypothetical protein
MNRTVSTGSDDGIEAVLAGLIRQLFRVTCMLGVTRLEWMIALRDPMRKLDPTFGSFTRCRVANQ